MNTMPTNCPPPARHAAKPLALALTLVVAHSLALADTKGTYTATVRLPERVSSGKLEYSLYLKKDDEAVLRIKRTSRLYLDRDSISMYGDQLTYIESPETVDISGTWSERRGDVRVRLSRIRSKEDTDRRDISIDLYKDGDGFRVDNWTSDFFGDTEKPKFTMSRRNNADGLIAGLAILAAGALIISSQNHSSGTEYSFSSGGDGNVGFGNGDRSRIDRLNVDLRKNRDGSVKLNGSYPVEFKGRWREIGSTYTMDVNEIVIRGSKRRASGNVYINLDKNWDRKRVNSVRGYVRISDDEWRNASIDFRSGRG